MRYAPSESDTRKKVRVLEDKYTLKLQEYIHNMCKERNMMKIQIDNVVSAIATSKIKKLKSKGK